MTVKTIDVDGFCWQIDDSGSGTAVVMCHGFPGLGYSYRHQSAALAEAGFRSIALDMPGYGGTTRPDAIEDYTNDAVANRLIDLLDALGREGQTGRPGADRPAQPVAIDAA